jgi:hypothetical protein
MRKKEPGKKSGARSDAPPTMAGKARSRALKGPETDERYRIGAGYGEPEKVSALA